MNSPTFMQKILKYLKKPWVIAGIIVIAIIAIFIFTRGDSSVNEEIIEVKSGTVREEVSVTGKVKAAQAVDLSFEKSGRVTKVNKTVGDKVKAGEIIVQIDNADLIASLAQAQASLRYQQSKLSELQAGTRPEQLEITKSKVASAKSDLESSRLSLITALQSAYSSADDAVRSKIDVFFINPRTSDPQISFVPNVTSETSLETGRVEVETRLNDMRNTVRAVTASSTESVLKSALSEMKTDLGEIKLFTDNISLSVSSLTPSSYLSETVISTWKANVSTARTSLNTAITSVLSSENSYNSAQSSYTIANQQYALDISGAVSQQIQAQSAQVDQADANVSAAYAALAKTYIKSPMNGIVTKQKATIGETIVPSSIIASVMGGSQFEIEANVPEADIDKIKLGEKANVTLDAYGSDTVFTARVVRIDLAETVIDGVPTYKTTFQFETTDPRIKSGMTANVDVQGQYRENALYLPQRAITSRNGQKFASLKLGETTTEVPVRTGIRGSDGSVEIIDGLSLGDTVVIRKK